MYGQNGYMDFGGGFAPQMPNYYQQPVMAQPQQQVAPPKTNKLFVTSLDDALSRPSERNSVMIYLHQDEPLLFEIVTDLYGKKSVTAYSIKVAENKPVQDKSAIDISVFATREELSALQEKISAITAMLEKPAKQTRSTAAGNVKEE